MHYAIRNNGANQALLEVKLLIKPKYTNPITYVQNNYFRYRNYRH